jgi:chromate reductase
MERAMSRATTVLGIPGSLRRGSWNRKLLLAAAREAPPGMAIQVEDALATLPLFDEDLERDTAGGPGPVQALRGRVAAVDGLLIATPEYNQSIPGVLKNAIDWLSRPAPEEVLAGKPVAIVGATTGRWGTRLAQAALRQVLVATESVVLPRPLLFLREAERAFDETGGLVDESIRRALAELLASFEAWIEAASATRRPAPRAPSPGPPAAASPST